jgi:hypothetical protein
MNVNDLTFGIEIETHIPANVLAVGPHGGGYPITQFPALAGWVADRDPSIRAGRGRDACEFVSPVLKGAEGLRQLLAAVEAIKALGARVNGSCGIHIHVGFNKNDVEASAKLATLVANFEKAIFASTGTKNRERGRWCSGLSRHGNAENALNAARRQRYHLANFSSNKPTVEFRAFSASLNPAKITAYLRLCLGLVERALTAKRTTSWAAKTPSETSPIHRSGEGQTALTRLYYQLGWTKGRQPHTHGNVDAEAAPDLLNSKKTLMALARKYDAQP